MFCARCMVHRYGCWEDRVGSRLASTGMQGSQCAVPDPLSSRLKPVGGYLVDMVEVTVR